MISLPTLAAMVVLLAGGAVPRPPDFPTDLERATELVSQRYRVPIGLELCPNRPEDAITIRYALEVLAKKPTAELSPDERRGLSTARMIAANRPEVDRKLVVIYKRPALTVNFATAPTVEEALRQLVAQDERYALTREGALYVIRPKDAKFEYRFDLVLDKAPMEDAYRMLMDQVLGPQGIQSGDYFRGSVSSPLFSWAAGNKTPVTLTLRAVSLVPLLNNFAQSLGPDYGWKMQFSDGYKGGSLVFTKIR